MPRQYPLHRYPDYYGELIEHVVDSGKEFVIWTADESRASLLRAHLYNYRYALRDEVRAKKATPRTRTLQKTAERVTFSVETRDHEDGPMSCLVLHPPEGEPEVERAVRNEGLNTDT